MELRVRHSLLVTLVAKSTGHAAVHHSLLAVSARLQFQNDILRVPTDSTEATVVSLVGVLRPFFQIQWHKVIAGYAVDTPSFFFTSNPDQSPRVFTSVVDASDTAGPMPRRIDVHHSWS